MPITSKPCSTSNAAATEESTPPLIARGVDVLDAARALVADHAHARGERNAQRVFHRRELHRAPYRPAHHRPCALGLHALLGGAHRPRVREDLLTELQLFGRGVEREQRARMTHREATGAEIGLDELGQLEQAQAVGNAAAITRDSLAQLLLRPRELGEQTLIGLRFFHRIQIFTQEVLDEGELEALRVARLANDRGNRGQPGELRRPPAPLAHDQLVAVAQTSDHDRLEHTALAQRCRKVA
jgi:hypothetical protein